MKLWSLVAVSAAMYQLSVAKVDVKITFRTFDNSQPMVLADGGCCESSLLSFLRCDQLCDPSIVVCLTTVVGACNEYKGRTGVYQNAAHVNLLNNMGPVKNPLSITMEDWKTGLTLQFDVNDYKEGDKDQFMDKIIFTYKTPKVAPHGQGIFIKKTLRGKNVILSLDIAVQCSQHFYGPKCREYCDVANLHDGHYKCNKDGKLVCQKGYTGSRCRTYTGACGSGPCMNKGTCVARSGARYKCYCGRHFTGFNCEVPLGSKPVPTPKTSFMNTAKTTTLTMDATQYNALPASSTSTMAAVQTSDVPTFHVGDFHTCNETLELNIGPNTLGLDQSISKFIEQYRETTPQYITVLEENSNGLRLTVKPIDNVPVDTSSITQHILDLIGNKPIIFNVSCSHPYVTTAQGGGESTTGVIVGATVGVLLLVGALSAGFIITKTWGSKPTAPEGAYNASIEDKEKQVLEMLQESKETIASSPPICSTD